MPEINQLSFKLSSISKQFGYEKLYDYAEELKVAAGSYDIIKIRNLLNKFPY